MNVRTLSHTHAHAHITRAHITRTVVCREHGHELARHSASNRRHLLAVCQCDRANETHTYTYKLYTRSQRSMHTVVAHKHTRTYISLWFYWRDERNQFLSRIA
jgi:hypothetical protein